ncbi:uncharacterized protein [Littorina saxatilis]|uniref:Uncharacterized protein n=1 Tax=Littorina saxatilis TaxID=31220 RepID=A0AAN9G5E8_9CAEN
MESRRVLTQLLVLMTCCLATALTRMTSSMQEDDVEIPDTLFSHDADVKRNNQEDISKLLLKHLRFRQLPEPGSRLAPAAYSGDSRQTPGKRHGQRSLVNNLAALLSGLRDRQAESEMRMPSLRFGK